MASSRTPSGRSRSNRSRRSRETTPDAVRDAIRKVLTPLDAVVITRDRLQEVLDDAVDRGRMTRDDAGDLLAELVRRGKRQTDELLRDIEGVVTAPADRVMREVDRARRATGLGASFPITGYDDLTAAQVTERLGDLSAA